MRPYQPQKPESHGLQGHTPQSSRVFRRFPAKYPDIGLNSVTPLLLRFSRWSRWHALSSYSQPFSHLRICSGESSWNIIENFPWLQYNLHEEHTMSLKNMLSIVWCVVTVQQQNRFINKKEISRYGRPDIQWYMQQSINEWAVCRFCLKLSAWSIQQLSHISYIALHCTDFYKWWKASASLAARLFTQQMTELGTIVWYEVLKQETCRVCTDYTSEEYSLTLFRKSS